jgi:DNA-binding MarR family transcriptional regulator
MKDPFASSPADIQARREAFYHDLRRDFARRSKVFDPLSAELCFNLAQTFSRAETLLTDHSQSTGLTLAALNVLIILRKHGEAGCPLNALSHLLVVTRANITGLIDSLVRKGLVTRTEHPKDRRVILARITKKGEDLLVSYLPTHHAVMRDISSPLSRQEKGTLIQILTKMRRGLIDLHKP